MNPFPKYTYIRLFRTSVQVWLNLYGALHNTNIMVEKEIPSILRIPSEVRGGIIFSSMLSVKDALSCRSVCQQFKSDVDEYVNFVAELDETAGNENGWFLPHITKLRLKEIKVVNLLGPVQLFGQSDSPNILRHPNLVQKLLVPDNSKVSVDNLHNLLSTCGPSLEHLELSLFPPVSTDSIKINEDNNYDLSKLKTFHFILNTMPPQEMLFRGPSSLNASKIPMKIMSASSTISFLTTLRVQIRCLGFKQVSHLSALFLNLICNNHHTLRILDFDLIQGHGVPSTEERELTESDLEMLDLVRLQNVEGIIDARIVNSTAIGISLWAKVLANQKNLHSLETDILPAPASLFRQIVSNNVLTLVEIDIGDLTLDPDPLDPERTLPFDLIIFSECYNLKKLTLDRNSMFHRRRFNNEAELLHLPLLPSSLSELNINYFLIPSIDFLQFFGPTLLALTSLSLTQVGDRGMFGVCGSVLQQIIQLPVISFIEISPLNQDADNDPEENGILDVILAAFGYPLGHSSYFQLNRVEQGQGNEGTGMDDLDLLEEQ